MSSSSSPSAHFACVQRENVENFSNFHWRYDIGLDFKWMMMSKIVCHERNQENVENQIRKVTKTGQSLSSPSQTRLQLWSVDTHKYL